MIVFLVGLIVAGLIAREWRKSQVVSHPEYRFNMALIIPDKGVTFVSFDPTERELLVLPFPSQLAIRSRSAGEYSISSLYKLGNYQGEGGKFTRRKIQGFMKVPVPGYLVSQSQAERPKTQLIQALLRQILTLARDDSSLTILDAILLTQRSWSYSYREIGEDELIRAGVIVENTYRPERLQDYVGTRLFDWGIGTAGTTVAVINESGENGLGSDMADFLSNLGLDVVMVRSGQGETVLEKSVWQVGDKNGASKLQYIFEGLFGLTAPSIEEVPQEYRSQVLVRVGKDAKELF